MADKQNPQTGGNRTSSSAPADHGASPGGLPGISTGPDATRRQPGSVVRREGELVEDVDPAAKQRSGATKPKA